MKIAINRCFGGFGVSKQLYEELGITWDGYGYLSNEDFGIESDNYNEYRACQKLIDAIEKIGEEAASGDLSSIEVIEIPDDVVWEIDDYDGMETIREVHRSW